MTNATTLETGISAKSRATVERFTQLAVNGLVPMFDSQRKLFCYRLKKTEGGLAQEGISPRYTLMTLMGLHRLEESGRRSPIACKPVLENLLRDLSWLESIGDLGLLLWACALVQPDRLPEIQRQVPLARASQFRDAREIRTMELAWFLTGLCYWAEAYPEKAPELLGPSQEMYARLCGNQGSGGFFGHLSIDATLMGRVRGRIGSFADQVYPIYAMAKFSRVFHVEGAAARALACGRGICDAQGPQGQWWWHYDSLTNRVFNKYPVFSVHQHAMAPMTLFALGEATRSDFQPWIYKGLSWINHNNELGIDMEDGANNLIWRCIYRPAWRQYVRAAFQRAEAKQDSSASLRVRFECRPYELGWLLYAFAGRLD